MSVKESKFDKEIIPFGGSAGTSGGGGNSVIIKLRCLSLPVALHGK